MSVKNLVDKMKRIEGRVRVGGGPKAVEAQHQKGRLTARERIDLFFDSGTFVELDMYTQLQCH
jgi:acetyl-CoA carboxylase carboxyltransferase component